MKLHVACVVALTVWGSQTFAAMDRCASPSVEEFRQNPPSNAAVQDFATTLKSKAKPIIAASVAKEQKIERERQAKLQAERERRKAERAAEAARRQAEWEASRPEREARERERERERAKRREIARKEAEYRRQNMEAIVGTINSALQAYSRAVTNANGSTTRKNKECKSLAECAGEY